MRTSPGIACPCEGGARATTQPLGAVAVGQVQMRKPTSTEVVDAMHPPVAALAARLADRGAVGDAQDASRPADRPAGCVPGELATEQYVEKSHGLVEAGLG